MQETAEIVPLRIQGASNKRTGHAGRKINDRCLHQKIIFQPIFDLKYLEITLEILLNQSIITKKPKNHLKTRNPPGKKILSELRSVVLA